MRLAARRAPAHAAAFYRTEQFLMERLAGFIAEGLAERERVIVLATIPHWNAATARLEDAGIASGRALGEGRLILIDAEDLLASVTANGGVSVERFAAAVTPLFEGNDKRRVYGEMVSLLVQRGDLEGALAIEALGHELAHRFGIHVLCGYATDGSRALGACDIGRIRQAHDRSVAEGDADEAADRPLHAVRFYENSDSLAQLVARFFGEGFLAGLPAVAIATPDHRQAIEGALAAQCFDVERLKAAGNLTVVDAAALMATFMVDGVPDPVRFRESIIPLIEAACRRHPQCVMRAYGEMVDVLWKAGQTDAAIKLEALWNQLAQTHTFALLCGYSMGNFYKGAARQEIVRHHSHAVFGCEIRPTGQ